MHARVKRYYVVIHGKVQDVGYRKRIESTAELFNLKGFPWNDVDGSVKLVCEGQEDFLNRFLEDIEIKEKLPSGIFVESMEKKEISIEFPLPPRFARLETEELADISRKLDTGNEQLKDIRANTGNIGANTGAMREALKSIDSKLDTLPERIAAAVKR
ncbi:MAG: acylphosphatase [Candidatus Hydrothermarchaeota archaeon]|nr:acylphosphatase [Candidatus Hydrothermarchaeota archaeon]